MGAVQRLVLAVLVEGDRLLKIGRRTEAERMDRAVRRMAYPEREADTFAVAAVVAEGGR